MNFKLFNIYTEETIYCINSKHLLDEVLKIKSSEFDYGDIIVSVFNAKEWQWIEIGNLNEAFDNLLGLMR